MSDWIKVDESYYNLDAYDTVFRNSNGELSLWVGSEKTIIKPKHLEAFLCELNKRVMANPLNGQE